MTIDDKIIDHKLQCNINREAAKIKALFSGEKKEKYDYLIVEEMLNCKWKQIIEQAKHR